MIHALILTPTLAGLIAFLLRDDRLRRLWLVTAALLQAVLTVATWFELPRSAAEGWLGMDLLGRLFLSLTNGLFVAVAVYTAGYLKREDPQPHPDFEGGTLFRNSPEAVFTGSLLVFVATMNLTTLSQHMGLLWVAIEATTLTSAPLIYFHRHPRSLEAAWKYVMICSVGIALALLGTFFLAIAGTKANGHSIPLVMADLIRHAGELNPPWLKAAFLLLLVGFGTKMGLAPLHTWLPDAHSESPSLVSALLSGALLNCAFLGILRGLQIVQAADLAHFGQQLLIAFGLFSMLIATVFILGQGDYKRLLAYSSIEHMGILALGMGLGGGAVFAALLHAVFHTLTKGALFLLSGNILAAYRTKQIGQVAGITRLIPATGALWLIAFLAISGIPPFGLFTSKALLVQEALKQPWLAGVLLGILLLIFIPMASAVLRMAQGIPLEPWRGPAKQEPLTAWLPPLFLLLPALGLGLVMPHSLQTALHEAAQLLGGSWHD